MTTELADQGKTREYIERALDPALTNEMAGVFGNDNPAPAKAAFFDHSLEGTGTYAYYCHPQEIKDLYGGRNLPHSLLKDTEPYIGLSPDLLKMPRDLAHSVIDHEKSHGAQPNGKLALLNIHAYTPAGMIPMGRMLVEGWNEYGLEKSGRKPPSRYFDGMHGQGNNPYSHFRDFVYELEQNTPGITRQIIRSARKGGPDAAMRLIESIPDIGNMATKYAARLNCITN